MAESELQKVKDLLDMGFIHEEEYERRIKEILGNGTIPPAFRVGNSANTATDPFEEERIRREEEELLRQEEELRREEEMIRREVEEERRRQEEEMAMRMRLQRELEEQRQAQLEAQRQRVGDEENSRRIAEETAKQRVQELARSMLAAQPPIMPTKAPELTREERLKAIEQRQKRDQERWRAEVAEEQKAESQRLDRNKKGEWSGYNQPDYLTPQETPAFDPNHTYSTPEYYAPHGIKLYPIYPASYGVTVHPFAFVAGDGRNPNAHDAGRNKEEEIKRIIAENKKNSSGDSEDEKYWRKMQYESKLEEERRAAMRKIIDETPKKPFPGKVDDGIDPNTLPKPTVHMIPPRQASDLNTPHEASNYIIPKNVNGVIILYRSEGSVCQTRELISPTRNDVLKMFELSQGKITNVQTGEEFASSTPLPPGCYKLERTLEMQFYRSAGVMPLYSSMYTYQYRQHAFHNQYERVPSAIADKRNTSYVEDIVFSYGNVRTTSTLRANSYNESSKPPPPPSSSYNNMSGSSYSAPPNWFKTFRENNVKTDYVVCLRNVFRKAGKEAPLRLHRALKDSMDNNKCVVCKQFTTDILCDSHKDERFAALVQAAGGNFGEIFGVSTEPLSMEEEVESPIYYKNHGEVAMHEGDKTPLIDFTDPNLQPKYKLNGILAERFNRIKENARMTYEMMMSDDYLVHKPGSEQAHLYD